MKNNSINSEDFVRKNINLEINIEDDPMSTWENNLNDRMLSPKILNRYLRFLIPLNMFLFSFLLLLIIISLVMIVWFCIFHPQEKIIFNDGTDITCLYDPKTEEMKQNDN